MKTTMNFLKTGLMIIALVTTSCSKDGEVGPIGPIGAQGEQGVQGQQGGQGPEGTANVMYSDWLDQDNSWNDSAKFKTMKVDESRLTNDFFNNGGIVLGFFRFQERVQYILPYTTSIPLRNTRRIFTAISFEDRGEVRFHLESTDNSDLTDVEVNGNGPNIQAQYKYVMIPGGINLTGKSQQPDFKKLTYEEVMDYFGLEY